MTAQDSICQGFGDELPPQWQMTGNWARRGSGLAQPGAARRGPAQPVPDRMERARPADGRLPETGASRQPKIDLGQ